MTGDVAMGRMILKTITGFSVLVAVISCSRLSQWSGLKDAGGADSARLKLVWLSLDGFQADALQPWLSKIRNPHPKGLNWLLHSTHGRSDLQVINPSITAPSHISTITCTGAGVHGILDNSSWTGTSVTSGFNRPYAPENWISRLRKQGLRVGSALYPSIDGNGDSRTPDVGIVYDNPGSQPQLLTVQKGAAVTATIPDRAAAGQSFPVEILASSDGVVTGKTPWGNVGPLTLNVPVDVALRSKLNGADRQAAVSFMLISTGDKNVVEVSPIEILPTFGDNFTAEMDSKNILFSGLRDYRLQSSAASFLASLEHRRHFVVEAELAMLKRSDLDVNFLYLEDLDVLLHGYIRDEINADAVVAYLERFDQDLGRLLTAVPSSSDLVVLGDHGMSAIGYVLNARKILTEEVASKGYVTASGGAVYLYPPQGDMTQDPPAGMDLNAIAASLRAMDFDLGQGKLFGKVIVRGSQEAVEEGLSGKNVPWIMAFANDGVGFKNSMEDKLLLARANWALIPEALRVKYPDPMNNGALVVPVPAGQHGHWNMIAPMRTRLVLEGPHLGILDPQTVEKTLGLVPAVADALHLQRPEGCKL
jgi:predicted AlkP superfamily pyrophosphatase or phosphodiesterase